MQLSRVLSTRFNASTRCANLVVIHVARIKRTAKTVNVALLVVKKNGNSVMGAGVQDDILKKSLEHELSVHFVAWKAMENE